MKRYLENEKLILAKLRETGATTKYLLAESLKISIPTVTTNINKLIKENVIQEVGVAQVDFGRKPVLLDINYTSYYALGIEIQTKSFHYCFMNLKLETVFEGKIKKPEGNLLDALKTAIDISLEAFGISLSQLSGIGISYPGIVDNDNLILKIGTNIGIDSICIAPLKELLDVPITVGNEANLAAFAENIVGVSRAFNNSVYLSINEGIGGGIVLDKHYYSGSYHAAGEIGHMIVQKGGTRCSCGAYGCLEAYLSINTLIQNFNDLLEVKLDACEAKSDCLEEVFKLYNPNDASHVKVLHDYLDYLIIALNNLFLIFDPDCIILGGELSYFKPFIEEYLTTELLLNASRLLSKNRKIMFSSLSYKASKLGAALVALQDMTILA